MKLLQYVLVTMLVGAPVPQHSARAVVITVPRRMNIAYSVDLPAGRYKVTWTKTTALGIGIGTNVQVLLSRVGKTYRAPARLVKGVHRVVAITTVEAYGAERLYAIHMPSQDLIFSVSPFKEIE